MRYARIVTLAELYEQTITLPRALRFPVELRPPDGFEPQRRSTWPRLVGQLEYVDGRLLFMPPCGDVQQYTGTDVVITLGAWVRAHPEFVLGTNEAGMHLAGDTRAPDAAIWRRADVGPARGGLQRVAPVLAVEVAGEEDTEPALRDKAGWYLRHGASIVWLVLPDSREVIVLDASGEQRYRSGDTIPVHAALPDLAPSVGELFTQLG